MVINYDKHKEEKQNNIPDWYDNICFLLESVLKRRLGQDCILQIERAVDYNMNKSICKKSIIQIQEF